MKVMRILSILTVMLFLGGCPDPSPDSDVQVETIIGSNNIRGDQLSLGFSSNVDNASFECLVNLTGGTNDRADRAWGECPSPFSLSMTVGQTLNMKVRAVTIDGRVDLTPEVYVYEHTGTSSTTGTAGHVVINEPIFQIGSAFDFRVPEGMHVTQYATTNTYFGGNGVQLVRLARGQSYDYHGMYPYADLRNDGCSTFANRRVTFTGKRFTYCESLLNDQQFFSVFNHNYARNHIEVATDNHFGAGAGITNISNVPRRPKSRLLVQTFGPKENAMVRKRFDDLCHPSKIVKPVTPFENVPMINGFFAHDYVRVEKTHVCTIALGGLESGYYQVGGFTGVVNINDSHKGLPMCVSGRCGSYAKYISVVYMERIEGANGVDHLFARNFSDTLLRALNKNRP